MMKSKIEVAANVVVILLAVVIGSVFLMDRFASLGLGPNEIKAGDKLLGLRAYNWKAHERTLVLALRNGCHFCEASMRRVASSNLARGAKSFFSNELSFCLTRILAD